PRVEWSVANRGDAPVRVRRLALVDRVEHDGALPMFRNGYQSWSRSSVAVLGADRDPACTPGSLAMMPGEHPADQRRARDGELRSEWVTALAEEGGPRERTVCGFDAGIEHDGTWRLRAVSDGGAELSAEVFLGDAELAPGERRVLHPFERQHTD